MIEIRVMDSVVVCPNLHAAKTIIAKALERWLRDDNGQETLSIMVKNLQYKAPPEVLSINVGEITKIGEAIG